MVIITSKYIWKNVPASGIFSVFRMRYHGYAYLWCLFCSSPSDLHFPYPGSLCMCQGRAELCPLLRNWSVLIGLSQCQNHFCHPRVTMHSVVSGSATPFPGSERKSMKISALHGHPECDPELSATESGFVAVPVQLVLSHKAVGHNFAFEIWHHSVIFAPCWNTEMLQNSWQESFWEERVKARTR